MPIGVYTRTEKHRHTPEWFARFRKVRPPCLVCGNAVKAMSRLYCSVSCRNRGVYADKTKHPNWNDDASTKYQKLRNSVWKELEIWRKAVLGRDGKCVLCSSTTKLQADHIKPFMYFPDLRFQLSNGRTLCYECHKKTDTFGVKVKKHKPK